MKRRIIAGLLSLIMVLSLFPAALAVDENSDTNILEQEEETLPDQAGPCTKTEGCILPEGHEGECSVAPEIPGEELETTPPEESEQEPASEEGTETETGDSRNRKTIRSLPRMGSTARPSSRRRRFLLRRRTRSMFRKTAMTPGRVPGMTLIRHCPRQWRRLPMVRPSMS